MIALAIETSAPIGSVALQSENGTVASRELPPRQQARGLAVAIDELLRGVAVTPRDLNGVIVSQGPGGYTGLRLGLATAKTFGSFLRTPLLGLPSTLVFAAAPSLPLGTVLVLLDARKGFVYGAEYLRLKSEEGVTIEETRAPFCLPIEQIALNFTPGTYCVGDGVPRLREQLSGGIDGDPEAVPTAVDLLRVGVTRLERGERSVERSLLPLYLRPSEAELLWRKRHATTSTVDEQGE